MFSLQIEKPAQRVGVGCVHVVSGGAPPLYTSFKNLSQVRVDEVNAALKNKSDSDVNLMSSVEIFE